MKKGCVWLLMIVVLGLVGAMPVAAAEPDGFTRDENGYIQIGDAATLTAFAKYINDNVEYTDANAVLTNDIVLKTDASDWASWGTTAPSDATQWIPIGMAGRPYAGIFDGAGHTISGIYINSTDNNQGLFGYCSSTSTIRNLGVSASYIHGNGTVGGFAGCTQGRIVNCHNDGNVTGNDHLGGLAGVIFLGNISNSYNTGQIGSADSTNVGGITGLTHGSITNSYSTGTVTGSSCVGGVTGAIYEGPVTSCYYLANTASQGGTLYGIGGLADTAATVAKTGTEFASGEVAWLLNSDASFGSDWSRWTQNLNAAVPDPSPQLSQTNEDQVCKITFDYANVETADKIVYGCKGGTIQTLPEPAAGTIETYTSSLDHTISSQAELAAYSITGDVTFTVTEFRLIANADQLKAFASYVNVGNTSANAVLTADIALNANAETDWTTWSNSTTGLAVWTPIGSEAHQYTGTFDGAGHSVSGIYINTSDNNQGFFGFCGDAATIKNLGVTNSYVFGPIFAGAVAGYMNGIMTNCYNTGTIEGNLYAGGLVGFLDAKGQLSNGYNTGSVGGNNCIGGLVGRLNGRVVNSYNTGGFAQAIKVGGLVGFMGTGTITNCYYLDNTDKAIGDSASDSAGSTDRKNSWAFTSGEVTWLLQTAQSDPKVQVWGQKLATDPNDAVPQLKATDRVFQLKLLKADGSDANSQIYCNGSAAITIDTNHAYNWTDQEGNPFASGLMTKDLTLTPSIATMPTVTAVYGTRLKDIPFCGGSTPVADWSWSGSTEAKEQILPVGNTTAGTATYAETPVSVGQEIFGTKAFDLIPTITARSLNASGVAISDPAASYAYTGAAITPAITVSDTGATITPDDYTITYSSNVSPGTATATVTITGKGNYQGTVTKNFSIYYSGGGESGGGTAEPGMGGITVTPGSVTFDSSGHLDVDISGMPSGSMIYYSLDGSTFSATPPAITSAGEHRVYLKITCPGYQDYRTETTVTVDKHAAPPIPAVAAGVIPGQASGATDLGALLPADRGVTRFQVGPVNDPRGILSGPPTIDQNGVVSYSFSRAASSQTSSLSVAADETAAPSATVTVQVSMANYADTTITLIITDDTPVVEPIGIRYRTHIQDHGWETDWHTDGALAGTVAESKRLEALQIELTGAVPAGAGIETSVHVQDIGDMGPFAMGQEAGTTAKCLRLEQITLNLVNLPGYTLYYNVHVQNRGWLRDQDDYTSWFKAGEAAGTTAQSLRLEAIQIKLVKNP